MFQEDFPPLAGIIPGHFREKFPQAFTNEAQQKY